MLEILRENAGGWVIKVLFGIIIITFIFAFGMSGVDTSSDPVLATVNDQVITRAEFEGAFQRAAENLRRANPNVSNEQLQDPAFKQLVLNELVNSRLLLAEAARLGVSASNEEVFAAITRQPIFWNADGQFDRNIYQMALRGIRMTPAQFEANFKNEYVAGKVKELVSKAGETTPAQAREIFNWIGETVKLDYILTAPVDFIDTVTASEEEIKKFYADNEKQFMVPEQVELRYISFTPAALATHQKVSDEEIKAYYDANADNMIQKEQVNARHILVLSKDSDPESVQKEARAKIDRIYKKAQQGEDFAELAKKYSEGPSSTGGGDLGWFGRGDMVPEFEEGAFETAKGKISEPIKTQFGWHIIKVEDRKDEQSKPLADVKGEIAKTLAEEKASEVVTELLDEAMDRLVSGMKLEDIAKELDLTAVTSNPVPEQFLPQAFGLTPEAAKVVMSIPVGEAHQTPLAIDGGYMLVEKAKDIEAAPMPLDQVTSIIENRIKQEKATEKAKKAADDILAKVQAGDAAAYADKVKTTEPFDRQGNIPELGRDPNLAIEVFKAKENIWLPQTFTTGMGIIVAKVNSRIPAPEKAWEEQKETLMQQLNQNYQQEVLTAFLADLRTNATIEIARPDLLN